MKMKVHLVQVLVLSVFCLISIYAWGSPAEELMAKLPADTSLVVATSGMEALEPAFQQAYLGQIWNDPQVQNFYHGIVDALLKKAPEGMDPNELEQIRAGMRFGEKCIQKPLVFAALSNEENPVSFLTPLLVMETGRDKAEYAGMLADLLKAAQVTPQSRMLGGRQVFVPEGSESAMLYWGWVDTVFIAAFNDPSGRVIQSFGAGTSFLPQQAFAGIADRGDALAVYLDSQTFLSQLKHQIEKKESPENAAKFQTALEKLGLDQIGRFVMRAGFDGPNVTAESLIENPSPPRGLFAQLGTVRPEGLCAADEKAYKVINANFSFAGIYDVIFNAIQATASETEYQGIQKQIAEQEAKLGFSIRGDLLDSLAGPVVGYAIPAYTIPEAPNGGGVILANLKNPEKFEKAMKALETCVQQQAKEQLQIQCQTISEEQKLCIWVSPMLSIAQVMPCWTIQDSKLIIASHPTLAQPVLDRLKTKTTQGSICQNERFQKARAGFPTEAIILSYTDSPVQFRQFLTAAQQFWPMLALAATQKGILLPMMLPNLDKYLAQLPPTICYSTQTSRGLEHYYKGPGLEASVSTIGGGAMGAAILMPALHKAKETAQRVVSATNLRTIGLACMVYSQDHEGKFPPDLEVLLKDAGLDPKMLESPYPRKTATSGPDYIYIAGQDVNCSPQNVLVYDNPTFGRDQLNILYIDSHVALADLAGLQGDVIRTYENLKRPIPPEEKERLGLAAEEAESPPAEN